MVCRSDFSLAQKFRISVEGKKSLLVPHKPVDNYLLDAIDVATHLTKPKKQNALSASWCHVYFEVCTCKCVIYLLLYLHFCENIPGFIFVVPLKLPIKFL